MRAARQLIVLALLLATAPCGAAEVWRWTDAEGQVRYGQVPPPDVKAERLAIPSKPTDPAVVTNELGALALRSRTNSLESEVARKNAETLAAKARAREEACKAAMARYEALIATRRIIVTDQKGEESFLSGDEAEARKEEARRKVEELCAS